MRSVENEECGKCGVCRLTVEFHLMIGAIFSAYLRIVVLCRLNVELAYKYDETVKVDVRW